MGFDVGRFSNYELLNGVNKLRAVERSTIAELVLYLNELDLRKLYRDEGFSSLFVYLTERLGYSKASAYRRTQAVKVYRKDKSVYEKLKTGSLTLSAVTELSRVVLEMEMPKANELMLKAESKSKEAVQVLVAKHLPAKEPKRERIVAKVDKPKALPLFAQNKIKADLSSAKKLSYSVSLEVDQEFMELYNRVKVLLPGYSGSMQVVFSKLLEDYEKRHSPKNKQERRAERVSVGKKRTSASIPQAVKDEVYLRDGGRCTYQGRDHVRCSATSNLEYDHITPRAKGGDNSTANIRLLCKAHNLLMAERHFGRGFVRSCQQLKFASNQN